MNEKQLYTGKDEALLSGRLVYDPLKNNIQNKYEDNQRMYQGIPTIERSKTGSFFYAFYAGGKGEEKGNYILLYKSAPEDDLTFQPVMAIEPPTPNCRVFDPCLWFDPDGRLWLFYAQSYAVGTHIDGRFGVWAITCDDPDISLEFSVPRRIANGIMMNKPTVTKDGAWLLSCAIWHAFPSHYNSLPEENFSNVYRSADKGESFELIGRSATEKRMIDEHMIVERLDGSLVMFIRSTGGIGVSYSYDGGFTWEDQNELAIKGPNTRFAFSRLKSGRIILVYHPEGCGRSDLTAWLSEDDGASFVGGLLLDDRYETSYPDLTEDDEGNIYIAYDFNRTKEKEMYIAKITEEDILAKKLVSNGSVLRILVNKATGINPNTEEYKAFMEKQNQGNF